MKKNYVYYNGCTDALLFLPHAAQKSRKQQPYMSTIHGCMTVISTNLPLSMQRI